jgi:hypothetical protein
LATLLEFVGLPVEKTTAESRLANEVKTTTNRESTYKGNKTEKPSKHNWTYKADAQEQAAPKKSGFKGKSSDSTPKRPRFNGKKSR